MLRMQMMKVVINTLHGLTFRDDPHHSQAINTLLMVAVLRRTQPGPP